MTLNSNDGDESGANHTASFVPLIVPSAKLSYRLNECYINSGHHTESLPHRALCLCTQCVRRAAFPTLFLIGMAECQRMDGWLDGWRETVSHCLFLSRWQPSASSRGYSQRRVCRCTVVVVCSRCCFLVCLYIEATAVCTLQRSCQLWKHCKHRYYRRARWSCERGADTL